MIKQAIKIFNNNTKTYAIIPCNKLKTYINEKQLDINDCTFENVLICSGINKKGNYKILDKILLKIFNKFIK